MSVVPYPGPGPLAAWTPPTSLQGWIHGVSGSGYDRASTNLAGNHYRRGIV